MYYILKNPFKNSSLEQVLTLMGEIPYFYDRSTLLGAYTQYGTALITHREFEDKRERRFRGWVFKASEDDQIVAVDPPVDFMQSPGGWLVGRADMWNCCGYGEHCASMDESAEWQANLEKSIQDLARHLGDDYHPLTFPAHLEADFYIVESVPNPTSGGGDGGGLQSSLDDTLTEVRTLTGVAARLVSDPPVTGAACGIAECGVSNPAVTHPDHAQHTVYIPCPTHDPVSDLLFDLWHLRAKHFGGDANKQHVAVIAPDKQEYTLTQHDVPSYWTIHAEKCVNAPNGWIAIRGTPESLSDFIKTIYIYLDTADDIHIRPDVTPRAFAAHVVNTPYSSRVVYYPICSSFYHEPL